MDFPTLTGARTMTTTPMGLQMQQTDVSTSPKTSTDSKMRTAARTTTTTRMAFPILRTRARIWPPQLVTQGAQGAAHESARRWALVHRALPVSRTSTPVV